MRVAKRSAARGLTRATKARISSRRASGDQTISSGAPTASRGVFFTAVHRASSRRCILEEEVRGLFPTKEARLSSLRAERSGQTLPDDRLVAFLRVIFPGRRHRTR